MTRSTETSQPFADLHASSQALREQTLFAHRQAATGATRARRAGEQLAELDLELAFRQLRQMVALVSSNRAADTENVVAFPSQRALAAE